MKPNIFMPLVIVFVVIGAGVFLMTPRTAQAAEDPEQPVQEANTEMSEVESEAGMPTTYTMADVEANATAESCYTAVDGKVYDLTAWIDQHPGGARGILRMCGIDGTTAFMEHHGGDPQAIAQIENYYIGELVE